MQVHYSQHDLALVWSPATYLFYVVVVYTWICRAEKGFLVNKITFWVNPIEARMKLELVLR